ncbi:class I SAM-dependent methyltransferase [Jatrophihabitans telluris]|uniref:Class I SAM-dependent methyltransferase n=1 Tax=Jatrophihabitans telluris TaxID=2038343 RepID=A0ABY4QU79_9ACTN|nr:class I SAM-dependent methyltransferase [Jatrophihabitans telluris]UQX86822.1 class I SAM-dependent methyltransferase [Jatrophihabitans telluris]
MDSAAWDERYAAAELVWSGGPNQFVATELADLAPGRALDLGAGEGRNALWLAQAGWAVTVVDFSRVALDKGRRRAEGVLGHAAGLLAWHHADLLDYQPEPAAFDLALICYLQVAPEPRRRILHRAAEALAQGGTLLVIGHDSTNLTDGVGGPQDAAVLYSPDDVVTDLALTGVSLRVERAERVQRMVDGADRPAIDVLVRALALGE